MRIEFREMFRLPVDEVYAYFPTPHDWVRLYGFAGNVTDRGDGWFAVPLQRFPFPLVTRVDEVVPNRRVHWVFRGFWRGEGEVNFEATDQGVSVFGFEDISIPRLLGIGPRLERRYLQCPFERLWHSGWRRLHKQAAAREAGQ